MRTWYVLIYTQSFVLYRDDEGDFIPEYYEFIDIRSKSILNIVKLNFSTYL